MCTGRTRRPWNSSTTSSTIPRTPPSDAPPYSAGLGSVLLDELTPLTPARRRTAEAVAVLCDRGSATLLTVVTGRTRPRSTRTWEHWPTVISCVPGRADGGWPGGAVLWEAFSLLLGAPDRRRRSGPRPRHVDTRPAARRDRRCASTDWPGGRDPPPRARRASGPASGPGPGPLGARTRDRRLIAAGLTARPPPPGSSSAPAR